MKQKVNVKKLVPNAILPSYGSSCAAGADLYACLLKPQEIAPGDMLMVKTGIAVEIPEGLAGFIFARSGLAAKKGLAPANKVGVIDSDYRGEIMVGLFNHSRETARIEPGERIAQMVLLPCIAAEYAECGELSATARGEGGFGSTGANEMASLPNKN